MHGEAQQQATCVAVPVMAAWQIGARGLDELRETKTK